MALPPLTESEADEFLRVPYSYVRRPRPVPAEGRALWRVPYVLLLVGVCRSAAASLPQLHVLNWAVRTAENAEALSAFLRGELEADEAVVRYEPALDRAIGLAGGLGLLRFDRRLWRLQEPGRELLAEIDADPDLLALERERLAPVSGLTQAAVSRLLGRSA